MLRKTDTILDDSAAGDPREAARKDADAIVTAVVVGFSAGRLAAGQPVEFSAEADGLASLERVVGLLNKVVPGGGVKARRTPPWAEGSLITGATGGARLRFGDRDIPLSDGTAEQLRAIAASEQDPVGYRGPGAYTGLVNDPVSHTSNMMTTFRENIPDGPGSRWVPPWREKAWGLIENEDPTMPGDRLDGAELVGYVHGIIYAGRRAVAAGPWCTPYEIAVGRKTTKLASCFACTLFMYANGFPPSNIHLGAALSWAPPLLSGKPGDDGDNAVYPMTLRWSLECRQQLRLGVGLLSRASLTDREYAPRLARITEFLDAHREDPLAGGNLVLDALTVHAKEADRIARVLG